MIYKNHSTIYMDAQRPAADFPSELESKPLAQEAWQRLTGPNSRLKTFDRSRILEYCLSTDELLELFGQQSAADPGSAEYQNLAQRIADKTALMAKFRSDMYSDDLPNGQ